MMKLVLSIVFANPVQRGPHGIRQGLAGAGLGRAQEDFELAESQFNQCKVGRVGRQEQQAGTALFYQFGQARGLVHAQVVEHDHVAGYQRGAEYLVKVNGKGRRVDGPVEFHHCLNAVGREGGNHRHVSSVVQRHGMVHALAAQGPAVAAGVSQVHAGFVHKL